MKQLLTLLAIASIAHAQGPSLPFGFTPQATATVSAQFVSGALAGTTINGATNTALTTQSGTLNTPCPSLTYCAYFPAPILSGNASVVTVFYASSPSTTLTVTNDKSQTFAAQTASTAASSKLAQTFVLCNTTAGAQEVKIAASTGVIVYDVIMHQFAGVASSSCVDASAATSGGTATTTPTGGAVTPTQTGDIIVASFLRAGTPACTTNPCYTAGTGQTGITWALRGTDYNDGGASEWGVYSSISSLTPAFTFATTSTYIAATVALKAANSGTAPTGMYPIFQTRCNTPASAGTTQKCQSPSTGNLETVQFNGAAPFITSVSGGSNTWITKGSTSFQDEGGGQFFPMSGIWWAQNATADASGALTFNLDNSNGGDATFVITDWAGAATVPYGTRQVTGGSGSTTISTLTYLSAYFPGITDGWVLASENHANGTATTSLSPSGSTFTASTWGGQSINGPSLPDQNAYWALLHNSAATSQAWELGYSASVTGGIGPWGGEAVSFISSTGAYSGPSIVQSPFIGATSGTTLTATLTASLPGTALVAIVGNQGGSRTVTKVCTDGTTCAGGNSFTRVSGATCTNSTLGNEGEIWLLTGHASGVTAVEATISGTITAAEMKVYEIRNISAVDVSGAVNNGTAVANVYTGPSLTFTGSPSIAVANVVIDVATGLHGNPASGNIWGYDTQIYNDTGDATGALIASSGTYSYAAEGPGATNGFCSSAAAFK